MEKHRKTKCQSCYRDFNIHENMSYQVRKNTNIVWFFDALAQFQNFNQVICPFCGKTYQAPEARLFGVFKSPYTVIILCLLLNIILLAYIYITVFKNNLLVV